MRLSLDSFRSALPGTALPGFDPAELGIGIAHLGCGAFMRAHQALATQRAIAAEPGDWGIAAASLVSPATPEALTPQDGLYTLLTRDGDRASAEIIGTLRSVVFTRTDPAPFIAAIAAARIVTLTITEKGYCLDPATLRLDTRHSDIVHDSDGAAPQSAIGLLVAGLAASRASGTAPPIVLSCDNLAGNGRALGRAAADFAALGGDEALARWIEADVRFPCTMVDRIVPAATGADRAEASAFTGLADSATVVAEPFLQWAIEGFDGPRPRWEAGGAEFVSDVAPYEAAKLRLLNAGHSALACLGLLAGLSNVGDAIREARLESFVRRLLLTETAPTLPPGAPDAAAYVEATIARWGNRGIVHRLTQIAEDSSRKLPLRLIAPMRETIAAGQPVPCIALVLAAWMQLATGVDLTGRRIALRDPVAAETAALAGSPPDILVDRMLAHTDIFGSDFPGREPVLAAMRALHERGVFGALEQG